MARHNNFSGFPGGGNNMQALMKQAQKMQKQMEEMSAKLESSEYEASSGGGMVTVKVGGDHEIKSITINPQVVDPDDVEMLQDLIIAAANEALRKVDADKEASFSSLSGLGGLGNLGGLF